MPRRVLELLGQSAGGVGRHVAEIVRALDGNGLAVDVAAPSDLRVEMPKRVIPVEIPSGPLRGHVRAIRTLAGIIRRNDYDLVHAHGLRAAIDAAVAGRLQNVPVIVTLHNLIEAEIVGGPRATLYARAEPFVVRLSYKTLVPSQAMFDRLVAAAPRSAHKIEVLYAGTAEPPVAKRSRSDVRRELELTVEHLVVTVARLHKQKALDVLLEAIARLGDSVALAVVGEGPLQAELEDKARTLGIEKRVRWLGYRRDVADIVAAADVFCLSSLWEAVPLAAQEAVQLGIPIVATEVGGLTELISDRRSGRLVPKNDAGALAQALYETLESEDLRLRYAAAARSAFDARFSREAIIARLKELYS